LHASKLAKAIPMRAKETTIRPRIFMKISNTNISSKKRAKPTIIYSGILASITTSTRFRSLGVLINNMLAKTRQNLTFYASKNKKT